MKTERSSIMRKDGANVKMKVDTTELDEVLQKVRELKETIYVIDGLISELEEAEINIEIKAEVGD